MDGRLVIMFVFRLTSDKEPTNICHTSCPWEFGRIFAILFPCQCGITKN